MNTPSLPPIEHIEEKAVAIDITSNKLLTTLCGIGILVVIGGVILLASFGEPIKESEAQKGTNGALGPHSPKMQGVAGAKTGPYGPEAPPAGFPTPTPKELLMSPTPQPTGTPQPTSTPQPTKQPEATATPVPTSTPTSTPTLTLTPTPTSTTTPTPYVHENGEVHDHEH